MVAAHDMKTLARAGKPTGLKVDAGGMVQQPPLKLLGWLDGYAQIIAQQPGGYDKARDMRVPDRAARYDLLRREIVWSAEIEDVRGWATVNGMRARDVNRWAFLESSEDLENLTLVDALGYRANVKLAIPFEIYDPRSAVYREQDAASHIDFTLAVDPLNPRALHRRKADAAKLDFYRIDVPAPGAQAGKDAVAAQKRALRQQDI